MVIISVSFLYAFSRHAAVPNVIDGLILSRFFPSQIVTPYSGCKTFGAPYHLHITIFFALLPCKIVHIIIQE